MQKEAKESCMPCELNRGEERQDCIPLQDYITVEEEDALSMLRKLGEESHKIKDKIRQLQEALKLEPQNQSGDGFRETQEGLHRELGASFQQLESLRNVWKEWEARREEANRRKMVLLGYGP